MIFVHLVFYWCLCEKKTAYRRVGDAKSKRKAIKFVNTPWALKQKRKGKAKIN